MKPFDYTLIRSRRRSLELRLYPDRRIEVRVPLRTSERDIHDFLASKADWLQRRLATMPVVPAPPPLCYQAGEAHLYLGQRYPLQLQVSRRALTGLQDGQLCLLTPDPQDATAVAAQLSRWYRQQAQRIFNRIIDERFPAFAARGYHRPQLRVRRMKSRWGSLSSQGFINLNLELIKTPERSIEYVVVHELCHLEHMNHGPGFRQLLGEQLPDWQQRRLELNRLPLC